MAQQDAPVRAESGDQAVPIEAPPAGADQVRDVRAVVSLPLHDESLGPDHLLRWRHAHGHTQHEGSLTVGEPFVVDLGHTIARAVDDVDAVAVDLRLAEPVRKRQVRLEARRRQSLQDRQRIAPAHEEVEVLRATYIARIVTERMPPTHEKGKTEAPQEVEGLAMATASNLRPRTVAFNEWRAPDSTHTAQSARSMAGMRRPRKSTPDRE